MSSYRYAKLEQELLTAINAQRYRVGERLPSVRSLCEIYQASKATVLHALQRLESQRIIEARPRSGFYVLPKIADTHGTLFSRSDFANNSNALEPPKPVTMSELWLDIIRRGAVFDVLPHRRGGQPPVGVVELHRCLGRALRAQRGDEHQYYDAPAGLITLREQIALQLSRRGCALDAQQICITSGCQQALFLALMACTKAGDVVAVESPGFYGVLQLLEQLQLQVVEVPTLPNSGMDMQALAEVLERWPVKACIVSPSFSTPAGSLMPLAARKILLGLAHQYDLAIIEDDIYADTALGEVPDPLLAQDTHERVILCGSLSKSLSRDIRVGWIVGGRWHARIVQLKLVTQLASSRALQQGVADYLNEGSYGAHIRRQKYRLREQCDALLNEIHNWSALRSVNVPLGGLTIWVELQEHINTMQLYHAALQHDVVITPGALFSASNKFENYLRISFAHEWDDARIKALGRLKRIIHP